jgi:hypothetical protein
MIGEAAVKAVFLWVSVVLMSKLEHQFASIRHVQHHAAGLSSRLRREARIAVEWIGNGDVMARAPTARSRTRWHRQALS